MKKARKPMSAIFTVISIGAVVLVMIYWNQSMQANKQKETSLEKISEVEELLNLDLDKDYPKTPREVAKLHGDMTRILYSGVEDSDIKDIAVKIRELCDDEFLSSSTQEQYLTNLYTDIALWNQAKRHISYNLVVWEDDEETYELDGKKYATAFISFTIIEKKQILELRKYTMRKDDGDRWKILGWEYIPNKQD